MKNSLIILACFLAGFTIQTFDVLPQWVANAKFETYALYLKNALGWHTRWL